MALPPDDDELGEEITFKLRDVAPEEWGVASGGGSLWLSCYRMFLVERSAVMRHPFWTLDAFGCRAIAFLGKPQYWHPGEFSIAPSDGRSPLRFELRDPKNVEAELGTYLLVITPFPNDPVPEDEPNTKRRIAALITLVRLRLGRNAAFDLLFENQRSPDGKAHAATPGRENPVFFGAPDMSQEANASVEALARAIEGSERRDALLLSLRWLDQSLSASGVDAFLRLWVALEIVGMPDETNVHPLVETLAGAYGIDYPTARTRFLIGPLHGVRSAIVHDGYTGPLGGLLSKYLQAVFIDVLREKLRLDCLGETDAFLNEFGRDLGDQIKAVSQR